MKPAPPNLYGALVETGNEASTPRMGEPWLTRHLALSTLLAARYVIEGGERSGRLGEVTLPAACLQRRAIELELKNIIDGARSMTAARSWLDGLDTDPYPALVPAKAIHDLMDTETQRNATTSAGPGLLTMAREALKETAFGPIEELPTAMVELVIRLNEVDDGAIDRLRFAAIKAWNTRLPGFQEVTPIDVLDTQERFEAIYDEHLTPRAKEAERNFGTWFEWESARLGDEVIRRTNIWAL